MPSRDYVKLAPNFELSLDTTTSCSSAHYWQFDSDNTTTSPSMTSRPTVTVHGTDGAPSKDTHTLPTVFKVCEQSEERVETTTTATLT